MNKETISIAFAVNADGRFEEKHFSHAEKFMIYEWANSELFLLDEASNAFKIFDADQTDVSSGNCVSITDLLKKRNVSVLVSRQFGKNIQMVKHLFVPVIINSETPEEVVSILKRHMRWIEEELNRKPLEFKLFYINRGIFKKDIRKEH
jgi:predicted Fe-Mo cluster-binding NifX family protein